MTAIVHRNLRVYRYSWGVVVASVLEPLLYLVSIGLGVGAMIGTVPGLEVSYAGYVGPALLATAAMNSAVNETTFSAYTRLTEENVYDAVTRTPVTPHGIATGEIVWASSRGVLSGAGFLAVLAALGLVDSPLALLAIPASALVGFTFGALGLLAMTFLRGWHHFQLLQLVMLPMFLFSTTFYPLSVYPPAVQVLVQVLPLHPSITLVRGLMLGDLNGDLVVSVVYLVVVGIGAWLLAARRLHTLLIR